jgi:phenylalanyl-tRNA synthetase beta chain
LGFKNKFSSEKFIIQVPSWRNQDISLPEDIVEEVARIYGYHRLPSFLMTTPIPTNYPDEHFVLEHQIKVWLADMGLNEIYTNSMVSEKLASTSDYSLKSHLKIKNALSEDWLYLRRSLIPSHLQALNQNPHLKNITFFEIANTYQPQPKSLPEEKLELIISSKKSFTHLKGFIETLLAKLHLQPHFKAQKDSAEILIKNKSMGTLGPSHLNPEVQIAILQLKPLLKLAKIYPQYQTLSPYPPIFEDMTFTLPQKTYLGPVIDTISNAHKLIQSVKLTKTYQQNYTFNITYQSHLQPLNDKKVAPIRKKIAANLSRKFRAKLVGKLK